MASGRLALGSRGYDPSRIRDRRFLRPRRLRRVLPRDRPRSSRAARLPRGPVAADPARAAAGPPGAPLRPLPGGGLLDRAGHQALRPAPRSPAGSPPRPADLPRLPAQPRLRSSCGSSTGSPDRAAAKTSPGSWSSASGPPRVRSSWSACSGSIGGGCPSPSSTAPRSSPSSCCWSRPRRRRWRRGGCSGVGHASRWTTRSRRGPRRTSGSGTTAPPSSSSTRTCSSRSAGCGRRSGRRWGPSPCRRSSTSTSSGSPSVGCRATRRRSSCSRGSSWRRPGRSGRAGGAAVAWGTGTLAFNLASSVLFFASIDEVLPFYAHR